MERETGRSLSHPLILSGAYWLIPANKELAIAREKLAIVESVS